MNLTSCWEGEAQTQVSLLVLRNDTRGDDLWHTAGQGNDTWGPHAWNPQVIS